MKTGIIGLPQVGKTSLFGILTKARLSEQAYANPREAHIGVAKVPDDCGRLTIPPSLTSAVSILCAILRMSSSTSWSVTWAKSKSGWSAWKKI